jgi:hypothetical protein
MFHRRASHFNFLATQVHDCGNRCAGANLNHVAPTPHLCTTFSVSKNKRPVALHFPRVERSRTVPRLGIAPFVKTICQKIGGILYTLYTASYIAFIQRLYYRRPFLRTLDERRGLHLVWGPEFDAMPPLSYNDRLSPGMRIAVT